MDIRCPQCQTLYEFDESQLDSGSATLKCRKCQHMFRLGEDAQPSREDERRWMVRGPDEGEILYCNAFDTLHRWIVEREVGQDWEISRTGDKWMPLGDVGEFRPIFQVVDNVSNLEGEDTISRTEGGSDEIPASGGREKRDTLKQFHDSEQSGRNREASGPEEPTQAARPETDSGSSEAARAGESGRRERGSSGVSVPGDSVSGGDPGPPPGNDAPGQRTESPDRGATSPGGRGPVPSGGPATQQAERQRTASPQRQRGGGGEVADSDRSDVQLDSDRFGDQSRESSSDEWSFGDDEVEFDETTEVADDEDWEYETGGRRWTTVTVVALVLAVGGAAYLWTFQRERVRGWMGAANGEETPPAETTKKIETSSEPDDEPDGEGLGAARMNVVQALGTASGAAESEAVRLFDSARVEARKSLDAALEAATEKAKEEADAPAGGGEGGVIGMLQRANEALERGDARTARRLYKGILEREPGNSEALTGVGWSQLSIGNPGAARRRFERALEVNPSFGDAYIGLGHANRAVGDPKAALEAYEQYLDRFPGGSKASIAEYQSGKLREQLGME